MSTKTIYILFSDHVNRLPTRKEAAQLPKEDRERVVAAVESLREDPLRGSILHAEWRGFRRLRVGPYGVVYAFDGTKLLISVIRVGHRPEVHR